MVILGLIFIPLGAGTAAMFMASQGGRRCLLILAAVAHLILTGSGWVHSPKPILNGWLGIDDIGLLFMSIISVLFCACAFYAIGYLSTEVKVPHRDIEEGFLFVNAPEATFIACLLFFLAAMTLVTLAQHLGLLWVGIEATTLVSAPLIYFHRNRHSLEATWKYLMICSVGIALALMGNFILSVAFSGSEGTHSSLLATDLVAHADEANATWLFVAFLFFLVGYGTKMGLAPMHTWLPDAHSQAPSLVSALLSGALLNCAFLGILRVHAVCVAAGIGDRSGNLLVVFGLISMGVASIFIMQQADFKRMLAYSSVEHMGILALGVGLGGAGAFGGLLHSLNHSMTKAALFMAAGTLMTAYNTREIRRVRGALHVVPIAAVLWMAGGLSIVGSPPFGTFMSEFTILKAAFDGDQILVAILYLIFLSLIFMGMTHVVFKMAQGAAPIDPKISQQGVSWLMTVPPVLLICFVFVLGVYIPKPVQTLLERASAGYENYGISEHPLAIASPMKTPNRSSISVLPQSLDHVSPAPPGD